MLLNGFGFIQLAEALQPLGLPKQVFPQQIILPFTTQMGRLQYFHGN
jgi:hypothetical protein